MRPPFFFQQKVELQQELSDNPAPETLPDRPEKFFQKSCCVPDRLLCILIPAANASGNKRERLLGELAQFG